MGIMQHDDFYLMAKLLNLDAVLTFTTTYK
jgi:hypothetical protein